MKKYILLILSFLYLYANDNYNPKFYIGFGGGVLQNNIYASNKKTTDKKSTQNIVSLKLGYGDIKAYSVEFNLNYIKNNKDIFSKNDKIGYSIDFSLLKAWDIKFGIYPYLCIGISGGWLEIERSLDKKLGFGSYNLGGGVKWPFYKTLELEAKYEYKFISYEGIDLISDVIRYKSHTNMFYLGINRRF